jgi:predicted sulfurtransferase
MQTVQNIHHAGDKWTHGKHLSPLQIHSPLQERHMFFLDKKNKKEIEILIFVYVPYMVNEIMVRFVHYF